MQMEYNFPQIDLFYITEFQLFAFLCQNQIQFIIVVVENNYNPLIVMVLDNFFKKSQIVFNSILPLTGRTDRGVPPSTNCPVSQVLGCGSER